MNRFPKIILTVFLIITVLTASLLSFGCDESYFTDNGESSQESEALPYYKKIYFRYDGGAYYQMCRFDKEIDTQMSEFTSDYDELTINVIFVSDITLDPEYIELVENEPLYDTEELKLEYRQEMARVQKRYYTALGKTAEPIFANVDFGSVYISDMQPKARLLVDSKDMDEEALEILKDIAQNDLILRINVSETDHMMNESESE